MKLRLLKAIIFSFLFFFFSSSLTFSLPICPSNDCVPKVMFVPCASGRIYCSKPNTPLINSCCLPGSPPTTLQSSSGSGGGNSGSSGLTNIEREINRSNFFKFTSLGGFIKNIIQVAIAFGALLSFIWLIWGGIEFIISGGNQDRTKSAKDKITSAIFGLGTIAVVWVIWRLILYFFGLSSSTSGPVNFNIPAP